jgi:hypothetical protein
MTKAQLIKKAEALGIDVDGRWNEERIQQEISNKEASNAAQGNLTVTTGLPTTPQAPAPLSPNQPTGTDSTNGLPLARFTPVSDTAPPKVVGITPGETPRPILATVEPDNSEKTIKVVLKADYWPEQGERVLAGTALDIPATKAKELMRTDKAYIPAPGDYA